MRPTPLHKRPTLTPLALAAAMAIALAAGHAPLAQAQSSATAAGAPVSLNLPAQPLGQALNALAQQANLQMTFPAALVAGKSAPAVSGSMAVQQALERLLSGSDLEASVDGSAVLVKAATPAAETSANAKVLSAVVVSGLRANRVSQGATGLAMAIKETPQSISILAWPMATRPCSW